ncbi:MAG: VOC family protein [Chitinophagales bacterium]|nr:VOC family protein [Sphingobacteriales bacterium]MCC7057751.1 VOC family protein [Chitinophagales bacterium]HMS52047.1 VOC family protein [Chitinophagales bacterium]
MSNVSIYLNFMGNTIEAFNFYEKVFQTQIQMPIYYNRDMPTEPGMPELSEEDKNKVMHICLPILGGTNLMGTDMLESMGHKLVVGNNITINLEPDTKEEADRLYNLLSDGATECAPMSQQFWGYWGCCLDKFGIRWMLNYWQEENKS